MNKDSNRFKSIPTEIGKLTELNSLGLGELSKRIDVLNICFLEKLKVLTRAAYCYFNNCCQDYMGNLVSFPTELCQLTKLSNLVLCKSAFNDFDSTVSWHLGTLVSNLIQKPFLATIYLKDSNSFTSIPSEIGLMTRLERIIMGKCYLWYFSNIISILFSPYRYQPHWIHNEADALIESIPSEIGLLSKMEHLMFCKYY